ncbi:MAG: aryl-sulfate sulfotransferase [Bacteroidota bacterium]
MKRGLLLIFLGHLGLCIWAQNTIGLIKNQPSRIYDGYNLLYPHNQPDAFLVDNCGRIVHTWEGDSLYRPGNSVYLQEDGALLVCSRNAVPINDPIWAGGGGENVELKSWDNESLWQFRMNTDTTRLHHDIAPLPNGHVLMIAWELKTLEESIQAGRDPASLMDSTLSQAKLWPDFILEYAPELDSIVWEWHAWDHLIQDFDFSKDNFGQVEAHPERIDINYDTHQGHPDWMHANAIDYNPVLDQILLCIPYFHEVWVIDHGISTEEAHGEKGDLLYRWGNPATYRGGSSSDQKLFFPHDIHWVDPTAKVEDSLFGVLALFNNRVGTDYSTGNLFTTPLDPQTGIYEFGDSQFLPESFDRVITYPEDSTQFFSNSLSSIQVLPNGNVLMLAGRWGQAIEVSLDNTLVWEYVVPLAAGMPVQQGTELSINQNITFRIERYDINYPAFEGRDLNPEEYWELNPNEDFCFQTTSNRSGLKSELTLYPNPVENMLQLEYPNSSPQNYRILDIWGKVIRAGTFRSDQHRVEVSGLSPAMYWLEIEGVGIQKFLVKR